MCRSVAITETLAKFHRALGCISVESIKIALKPGQGVSNTENRGEHS